MGCPDPHFDDIDDLDDLDDLDDIASSPTTTTTATAAATGAGFTDGVRVGDIVGVKVGRHVVPARVESLSPASTPTSGAGPVTRDPQLVGETVEEFVSRPALRVSTTSGLVDGSQEWEPAAAAVSAIVPWTGMLPSKVLDDPRDVVDAADGPWSLLRIGVESSRSKLFWGAPRADRRPWGVVAFDPDAALIEVWAAIERLFERDGEHWWILETNTGFRAIWPSEDLAIEQLDFPELDQRSPHDVRAGDVLSPGVRFYYEFDLGDRWIHAGRVLRRGVDPMELDAGGRRAAAVVEPSLRWPQYG